MCIRDNAIIGLEQLRTHLHSLRILCFVVITGLLA